MAEDAVNQTHDAVDGGMLKSNNRYIYLNLFLRNAAPAGAETRLSSVRYLSFLGKYAR